MEITFTRATNYSISLMPVEVRQLAKKMGISARRLEISAAEGELTPEQWTEIRAWLVDNESSWDNNSEDDIDDIEVHV